MTDRPRVTAYLATSLDGYIAGPGGDLSWLADGATPDEGDYGFARFEAEMDAIVMGRRSYEAIVEMDAWPYTRPVFVLSRGLARLPQGRAAGLLKGEPGRILDQMAARSHRQIYLDGGATVRGFLERDLVDRMILTRLPVVLGGGTPLFGTLDRPLRFRHEGTVVHGDRLVMSDYVRDR
jgi:dihydrofolate reductase